MIYHGDCLDVMKTFPDNHFTSIITDPPYGLGFMNKDWDKGIPGVTYWQEALRVCKPGAMMLCFGGTRTYHRLTCAIEDAGWEIRDCLMWLYGSGFPKSMDISKAIDKSKGLEREIVGRKEGDRYKYSFTSDFNNEDTTSRLGSGDAGMLTAPACDLAKQYTGYGTALKPSYEPIIMSMKPLDGTFAQNAEKWGVAGINIDATRIGNTRNVPASMSKNPNGIGFIRDKQYCDFDKNKGRWPANTLFDEQAADMLGEPSRFFYCAKASSDERNKGCDDLPLKPKGSSNGDNVDNTLKGPGNMLNPDKNSLNRNFHPTVKPLKLMEYLIKLIAPPKNALILDPFAGSGTTCVAAKSLGIDCVGIELNAEYVEIANARLK